MRKPKTEAFRNLNKGDNNILNMNLKQFLKPTKKKIILTLILWLFVLPMYVCMMGPYLDVIGYTPHLECFWMLAPISLLIFLLPYSWGSFSNILSTFSFLLIYGVPNLIIAYKISCAIMHFWNKRKKNIKPMNQIKT